MRYSLTGRASDSDSGGCRFESCYRSYGYVAQWQSIRLLTEGLWVRAPPYPLFQDSSRGRAPASYAEGYGIMEYNEKNRAEGIRRYDVGVDANNFFPVSVKQIIDFFGEQVNIDDHNIV